MPIQHAVLSLLAAGPSHGYELKVAFEAAVGPQWGTLNIGHLYQVLDRLSRSGHVVSHRHPQQVKPDRVVYAITPSGTAELARWLDEPSPRGSGFRDDFFLKVTAAARTGEAATVRAVLRHQRGQLLRELRNLGALQAGEPAPRAGSADPVRGLLLSAATRHVEADLLFIDDAEAALLHDGGATLAAVRAAPPGAGVAPPEDQDGTDRQVAG